jgi:hypothetical protein
VAAYATIAAVIVAQAGVRRRREALIVRHRPVMTWSSTDGQRRKGKFIVYPFQMSLGGALGGRWRQGSLRRARLAVSFD